ncbi:MAG: hypothetical protein ACI4O9_00255 [Akkermansia sp.]
MSNIYTITMKSKKEKYHLPASVSFSYMRQQYGVTRAELANFLHVDEAEIQELEDSEFATDELRERIENVFEGETPTQELLQFWRDKSRRLRLLVIYILYHIQKAESVARLNIYSIEDGVRCYKLDMEEAQRSLEIDEFIRSQERFEKEAKKGYSENPAKCGKKP